MCIRYPKLLTNGVDRNVVDFVWRLPDQFFHELFKPFWLSTLSSIPLCIHEMQYIVPKWLNAAMSLVLPWLVTHDLQANRRHKRLLLML